MLQLEMIANYPGMVVGNNKVLFSEPTLRKIMPKHVKLATKRYKLMCGCQSCVIVNDMYDCLLAWRIKKLLLLEYRLSKMEDGVEKLEKQVEFEHYRNFIMVDGKHHRIK